jgi:multiple sugar transport system permease protein
MTEQAIFVDHAEPARAINQREVAINALLYAALVVAVFVTLIPIFLMVITAFKSPAEIAAVNFWPPQEWRWQNFIQALSIAPFGRYFINTLIIAFGVTILHTFFSALMAFAFARLRFPGRELIFLLFLATFMIPAQVTIIPQFILVKYLGWIDTFQGIVLPQVFTAFGTFFLRQSFLTIPRELDEAAHIDGCSRFGIFWRIILPLSMPAIATLMAFSVLFHWNNLLWPLIVSNSDATTPIAAGLGRFTGQAGTSWHLLMAAATMSALPTIVVFVIAQRFFVRGVMLSGFGGR